MQELEIEAVCVLHKKLQLRAASGALFNGVVNVFECENPFCLIFQISTEQNHSARMDVFREDLGRELKEWLDGSVVRNPAIMVSERIEEAISLFVRFGQTPAQSDLIMWILSRSEITFGDNPSLEFGSLSKRKIENARSSSAGRSRGQQADANHSTSSADNYDRVPLRNNFPSSTPHITRQSSDNSLQRRSKDDESINCRSLESKTLGMKTSTGTMFKSIHVDDNLKTLSTTKEILGKSIALSALSRHTLKGRTSSAIYDTKTWSSDHFRLVGDIEKARKDIEKTMDERRRVIEISKARQKQASEKYGQIRTKVNDAVSLNTWVSSASNELQTYYRIQEDIDVEVLRQRSKAQRACQKTRWTIAPNGFINRRGKYEKGPYMGQGPLPPEATSKLRDVSVEEILKHYYWDASGRRHNRIDHGEQGAASSTVEFALEAIKKASANISTYKLDLKEVFDHFDVDGNGHISIREMEEVFKHLGVKLDKKSLVAVFKHFDPNGSGWIDYGEFTWAFFNRRNLVRKWQRSVQGMTEEQIEARFHAADINGDNELSFKEFDKLLTSFNVTLSNSEREQLFRKFDNNGNGSIQLEEFVKFIHAEQEHLHISARKKHTESNERKWNNSVTYKVDLAQIAAQQTKRELARAEKLARQRSNSPRDNPGRSQSAPPGGRRPRASSAGSHNSRPTSPSSAANNSSIPPPPKRGSSPTQSRPGSPATALLRPKSPGGVGGSVWGRPSALPESANIAAKHRTKSLRPSRSSILIARGMNAVNFEEPASKGRANNNVTAPAALQPSKSVQVLTIDPRLCGPPETDEDDGV